MAAGVFLLVTLTGCAHGSPDDQAKAPKSPAATTSPTSPSSASGTAATPVWPRSIPTRLGEDVQQQAAKRLKRLQPLQVATAGHGLVLVVYGTSGGNKTAWRLFNGHDQVVTTGPDAWTVASAGSGFLLSTTSGLWFVDKTGRLTAVRAVEGDRRPVADGDVFVPNLGVFRRSEMAVFKGIAEPDGVVSAGDSHGGLWALGRTDGESTIVRSRAAGRKWVSHTLGPTVHAGHQLQGQGNTLMVVGPRRMYVSWDAGSTWRLMTHGASAYSGLPGFEARADGTIFFADGRGTAAICTNHLAFRPPTETELGQRTISGLYARGEGHAVDVSLDRLHWEPFTPATARRLLRQADRTVG